MDTSPSWICLFLLIILPCICFSTYLEREEATPEEVEEVLQHLQLLLEQQESADRLFENIPLLSSIQSFFSSEEAVNGTLTEETFTTPAFCSICGLLRLFVPPISKLLPPPIVKLVSKIVCGILEPGGNACYQLLVQNILPILDVQRYGRGGIAWEYLCWSLSNLNCKINGRIPNLLWSVPHFSNLGEQKQVAEVPSSDFKVIHLTDIHSDPEYKGKSFGRRRLQICSEPTGSQNSEILLGEYGNWEGCGIPEKTFQSAVDHIKSVHSDAAYILETGDSAASDFWSQTRAGDLALYQRMKNYLSQQLPGMPVYPVIGNHDTLPVNVFPPMNVRTATPVRWLYQAAAIRWSQLPLTARRTAKWAGVYVIQLPNNLRIITINTLYCYKSNWWVFTKLPDPAYQLEWLRRELQAAEDTKNLVHIVGHVAPGTTECLAVWFHHYAKLVDRYSHIIRGEFYGHQHDHIFNVVHTDRNPSNRLSAKSVAFLGPSLHTLPSLEPAYVVYTIDGTTKRIKELEEWYLDTEDGDKNGVTSWKKLYDFRTTFGSVPENPQEWHDFVQEIKQNETTKELFYNTARRGHSSAPYSLEAADSLVYYLEGYDRH